MNRKVTVVGGAGNVGMTVARAIAEKELADVVIIDIADQKAAGVALDIYETCPVIGSDSRLVGGGDWSAAAGSDIVVITAGIARNPGSAGCQVRYRAAGQTDWKQGFAMWYDSRNSECRGSLVHLDPGTSYEVQMGLPGQAMSRGIVAKTWREDFPIARTVHVQPGQTLNITQGGTADGYVLYTPAPGTSGVIDSKNAQDHNVLISAPYVIVRGFTLRGAKMDAVRMVQGASVTRDAKIATIRRDHARARMPSITDNIPQTKAMIGLIRAHRPPKTPQADALGQVERGRAHDKPAAGAGQL